jgi:hypothetical protein
MVNGLLVVTSQTPVHNSRDRKRKREKQVHGCIWLTDIDNRLWKRCLRTVHVFVHGLHAVLLHLCTHSYVCTVLYCEAKYKRASLLQMHWVKGRVHLRYDMRFDLRFGPCVGVWRTRARQSHANTAQAPNRRLIRTSILSALGLLLKQPYSCRVRGDISIPSTSPGPSIFFYKKPQVDTALKQTRTWTLVWQLRVFRNVGQEKINKKIII